ncbi:MAG: phosphoribosylamine--glycine ligase [Bernardetiaceae bacterium]
MNVLVLGSGGREHALSWAISRSPLCRQLFIAPGNAGTATLGVNVPLDLQKFAQIADLIDAHQIDLVIVGPEEPLVKGLVDFLKRECGPQLHVIGPQRTGAQLEGSKEFAKQFMQQHGIPTARYRSFTADTLDEGLAYLAEHPVPVVLKADGLAAGKGVYITDSIPEAQAVLVSMLEEQRFGAAGQKVVIEEFLAGIELSLFVLTDGKTALILPAAKDYKRIGEGDTGLNTGGMGAVSPVPFLSDDLAKRIQDQVVEPTVQGLAKDQIDFVGFLFIGLMIVDGQPYVLEYNVRMGDPETQAVLPRIQSDVLEMFLAAAQQQLDTYTLRVSSETAVGIVLVSGGYPETYQVGKIITGLEELDRHVLPFHAGTLQEGKHVITNGGRVIALTALGDTLEAALRHAKRAAETIQFEGKQFRRDIGKDLMDTKS